MALNILLSNDDGIEAEGLIVLEEIVKSMGHNVFIVAPDKNQSATSHSITLTKPLRINGISKNKWETTGTPTDCVLIATHGLMNEKMDMIISGINHGPNMGEDILYSGTVAAAMEGHLMGISAIAISLATYGEKDFTNCKNVITPIIDYISKLDHKRIFINVNIPNKKNKKIKGIKITKLGSRVYSDILIEKIDPRGEKYYWIGGSEPTYENIKGTDFEAVGNNYISITPLHPDLTDRDAMKTIEGIRNVL